MFDSFGGFDGARFGGASGHFEQHFRCYSTKDTIGSGRKNVTHGGKVILPQSALAKLASLNITYPMLFELSKEDETRKTHAGVLEFTAEEGRIYVPPWMMKTLDIQNGDLLKVTNANLPVGSFVKIQPQSVSFLDITDPKAVLENALRNFSTLTLGDIISIEYNDCIYDILVMEVKPHSQSGISIVETDLEVWDRSSAQAGKLRCASDLH